MTGESYGVSGVAYIDLTWYSFSSHKGRYLPIFASEVYDQNTQLVKEGRTPINLKSVMIGNGGTSVCTSSVYGILRILTDRPPKSS